LVLSSGNVSTPDTRWHTHRNRSQCDPKQGWSRPPTLEVRKMFYPLI
jgi:hypothetical protein